MRFTRKSFGSKLRFSSSVLVNTELTQQNSGMTDALNKKNLTQQGKRKACLVTVFLPSLDGFGDERDVFEVVLRSGFTILTVVLRHPDCSFACGSVSVPFACISMVKCERWFEWRYVISGRIVVDTTKQ